MPHFQNCTCPDCFLTPRQQNLILQDLIEDMKEWGDEEGLQAIYQEINEEKQHKKHRMKTA